MEKYSEYKDSGIEWIGQIPKHWKIKRLKDISNLQFSNVDKKIKEGQKDVLLCNYVDVYKNDFINNSIQFMPSTASKSEINRFSLEVGDIMFTKDSESFDDIANSAVVNEELENVVCGYHLAHIRANKKFIIPRYLGKLFHSTDYNYWFRINATGITRVGLGIGSIKNTKTFLPPLQEQTQIANYLDAKTKVIDQKISLLQQKITHYKAYRKTLINETVTKGLDKSVKLKDSGVEWIGEIPEHWEVKRIKDIFSISRGRAIAKTELKNNAKYPVYSSQTKNDGILGYIETFDFNANLLTWTTDGVNAGTVFIRKGKFNCTNICGTLIPNSNPKLSLEYMAYAVQESTKHNKRIDTNGAKIMSNEMAVIYIVFPPLLEQTKIASFINSKTNNVSKIINNIETQISTLKELRKTLINEVVTGKVKVVN